jgi:aerobic carbon-monoxide dehydrogenase medium subunit
MYLAENAGLISASSRDLDNFDILRPKSVAEAVALLNNSDGDPVAYAGGTDLVAAFRQGKTIGTLVWLKDINELTEIRASEDTLHIGALVTHAIGSTSDLLDVIPGFKVAWNKIATVRIRFSATIGGNLMAQRTRYEMSILLSALDAKINLTNSDGAFTLTPDEMWESDNLNGALLTSIEIPLEGKQQIDYERSMRPMYTQAVAIRGGYDGALGRVVIATEHLRPRLFEFSGNTSNFEAVFDNLPKDFSDPILDNDYIRGLAPVFLKRQLARLGVGT